ncbi:MAG: ATP-dependent DNA helicase [Gemmiger sp.]
MNNQETTGYETAHRQADQIFRQILPSCGMTAREGQIRLCHTMLDTLFGRGAALCDAGVGLGKTYAYLVAAILWMQQRALPLRQPVIVSTASIALQDAILNEYIPFLSDILIQYGIIDSSIQAVLRKGKGRYACDLRLSQRQREVARRGERFARRLRVLQNVDACMDLDRVRGLTGYDRRRICVPERCGKDCAVRNQCRYQRYLYQAEHDSIQIQVCNHNYLLADAFHRQNGWKPLLRDYSAILIDEAHKLPEVNQQMQTRSLRVADLQNLANRLASENRIHEAQQLKRTANLLVDAFTPLPTGRIDCALFDPQEKQNAALKQLVRLLQAGFQQVCGKVAPLVSQAIRHTAELAQLFLVQDTQWIRYVEYEAGPDTAQRLAALHAVPADLPHSLDAALWSQGKPAILTSGTLAAGGDFSNTRRQLGLEHGIPVRTLQVPSPFDYAHNCLLVFPRTTGKQSCAANGSERIAMQIRSLVAAAHGHTLALFTAYEQMGAVYESLKESINIPILQARRGAQTVVEQFKHCENAVLFAGGPCWEGVDFPGDMVSLLIIVRLPFPVPDPVREARREQYPDLHSYIRAEIVPEMQQKLRQGFGRAIRTETDSCAVAILDPRAAPGGRYHRAVLDALPAGIPITTKTETIQTFLRAHKGPEYFLPDFEGNSKNTNT